MTFDDTAATDTPATGPRTKRACVIDSAAEVFCTMGYSGASIDAVATHASVSRQTIYNQIGDKQKLFEAVVTSLTERSTARFFEVLDTFPDDPMDIRAELTDFGMRLLHLFSRDHGGKWLMRLMTVEGHRHPELFATWRQYGPGRKHPAVAARFAQLAHAGHLDIDEPDMAARHFMAMLTAEIRFQSQFGQKPTDAEIERDARSAVDTFLRAFAPRD